MGLKGLKVLSLTFFLLGVAWSAESSEVSLSTYLALSYGSFSMMSSEASNVSMSPSSSSASSILSLVTVGLAVSLDVPLFSASIASISKR